MSEVRKHTAIAAALAAFNKGGEPVSDYAALKKMERAITAYEAASPQPSAGEIDRWKRRFHEMEDAYCALVERDGRTIRDLQQRLDGYGERARDAVEDVKALQSEVEGLKRALETYAEHDRECQLNTPWKYHKGCDCGLSKALETVG